MKEDGLVDCCNAEEFFDKLEDCRTRWEALEEECPDCQQGFYDWFVNYKDDLVEESMLRSVCEEAGLGSPPEEFSTNVCESISDVLKLKVEYKKSSLPEFLDKMKELADEQEREVEHAVIKHGKYEFLPEYQHLQVPEKRWFRMSLEQQKRHLNKVAHADVAEVKFSKSLLSGPSSSSSKESGSALSVQVDSLPAGINIPYVSLEGIWKKASELLGSGDSR